VYDAKSLAGVDVPKKLSPELMNLFHDTQYEYEPFIRFPEVPC
jgi:hypothetical protein